MHMCYNIQTFHTSNIFSFNFTSCDSPQNQMDHYLFSVSVGVLLRPDLPITSEAQPSHKPSPNDPYIFFFSFCFSRDQGTKTTPFSCKLDLQQPNIFTHPHRPCYKDSRTINLVTSLTRSLPQKRPK